MPQFKSKTPIPGSEADKLPRDENGEVDASASVSRASAEAGVKTDPNGKMLARKLKASQAEMEGAKSRAMMLDPSVIPRRPKSGYPVTGM